MYDFKLQTYISFNNSFIKIFKLYNDDPYLSNIMNKTAIVHDVSHCITALRNTKNVSCITKEEIAQTYINFYESQGESALMKIAKPKIFSPNLSFYWFADFSSYAMKFLKTLRRVKETNLMHREVLLHENCDYNNYSKINKETGVDNIHPKQLIIILIFGFALASIVFMIEFVIFIIHKMVLSIIISSGNISLCFRKTLVFFIFF